MLEDLRAIYHLQTQWVGHKVWNLKSGPKGSSH